LGAKGSLFPPTQARRREDWFPEAQPDGTVINGPAVRPLAEVEHDASAKTSARSEEVTK
jgi:hypothetical protein